MKKLVYLDYNATTPVLPELATAVAQIVTTWGNPSSIHWAGQAAKNLVRTARANLAAALGISPLEIVFTSGGSEANNTVIKGQFFPNQKSTRNEYITTTVEHPSILKSFQWIESQGAKVHYVGVDREGNLDLKKLKSLLSEKTALVSVMFANNETGILFPVREIAEMAHSVGAVMHTDAVQAFGKVPLNLAELNVDFASLASHKFYGLKGTGILFSKKGSEVLPLIHGGGQERHRRGGTEGTLGIFALGFIAAKASEIKTQSERIEKMRNQFEAEVLAKIPDLSITQRNAKRLPNTSSLVIPGVDGETLLMSLDVKGYAVSTGAACSSGNPEPSPALLSMGLSREEAQSSLRVSLGWPTTEFEMTEFTETLVAVVERLKKLQVAPTFAQEES